MSIRYVATVLDHLPELTATEALVLVALADYASDDTRECWPSIGTIARRARCDRRTAQRKLKALEQRGLIDRALGGHQYGRNSASRYRLKFDYNGAVIVDTDDLSTRAAHGRRGAAATTGKGGSHDIQGRHGAAPSVIRSVIDPKSDKKSPNKEAAVRAAAALSDDELEQRARSGKMTAAEEYEREHRRRMRPRKAAP